MWCNEKSNIQSQSTNTFHKKSLGCTSFGVVVIRLLVEQINFSFLPLQHECLETHLFPSTHRNCNPRQQNDIVSLYQPDLESFNCFKTIKFFQTTPFVWHWSGDELTCNLDSLTYSVNYHTKVYYNELLKLFIDWWVKITRKT